MKSAKEMFELPKVEYLHFCYMDEYKTLHQAYEISKKEFIESRGEILNYMNTQINPNLKYLYEIVTLDKYRMPIKTIYFNKDGSKRKTMIYDEKLGWLDAEN